MSVRAFGPPFRAAFGRILGGLGASFGLLLLELLVVALFRHRELASIWELEFGALFLMPVAWLLSVPLGLFGILGFVLLQRAERRPERLLLAGGLGAFACLVGFFVGGGRHLSALPVRAGFALLVGLAVALPAHALAVRVARELRARPLRGAAAIAFSVVLIELVNRWVLPRLYPAFHWGLAALALMLAPSVVLTVHPLGSGAPRRPVWLVLGPCLLGVLGLSFVPASHRLSHFDNFRLLLLEDAPLLGRAVEIAARVAPPPALGESCEGAACAPDRSRAGSGHLNLERRDVLLISIDALRADHVGAYGYPRKITPNLDRLAEEGVLFERAYAPTPHTSYSVTSMMTGKYLRPLLLQGAGADSDTWASLFRTYGYRTGAFYPPAVFFIDGERFRSFEQQGLGFEYKKVEFAEGKKRVGQVRDYLAQEGPEVPLFCWVHLFAPHEPYQKHAGHELGDRDIDRYDSEIAWADATLGELVAAFRKDRPRALVIVTADHGEEFGDHGGRYHGTTVYEEQVRVPLVLSAPGLLERRRIGEVVQTIDLLPTVLGGLSIPIPPRLRGRDLGDLLSGARPEAEGFAHAETSAQTLLARGPYRLVCERRIGACRLFRVDTDPGELTDLRQADPARAERMQVELRALGASHGRFESQGLRAEGKGWPPAMVRALAGDGDAATEVASLLDDADLEIRRKAAEILFDLKRSEAAPALRLALGRDEDPKVRTMAALALTRLGEGAPLSLELLHDPDRRIRRLAALSLCEAGERAGLGELLRWWGDRKEAGFSRTLEMVAAFATLRARSAVAPLIEALRDTRLRPHAARALATIGDSAARVPLARALADERSQSLRVVLTEALLSLGGKEELIRPLVRFLGVPDPLKDGLKYAVEARILQHVGGPTERDLPRLGARADLGTRVRLVIPRGGNGHGIRAIVRASCEPEGESREVRLGSTAHLQRYDREGKLIRQRGTPALDDQGALRMTLPCTGEPLEVFARVPETIRVRPGLSTDLILFASHGVQVQALALVPLADELPAPPPQPWSPGPDGGSEGGP